MAVTVEAEGTEAMEGLTVVLMVASVEVLTTVAIPYLDVAAGATRLSHLIAATDATQFLDVDSQTSSRELCSGLQTVHGSGLGPST
jgi:hypothetical protein